MLKTQTSIISEYLILIYVVENKSLTYARNNNGYGLFTYKLTFEGV